MLQSLSWAGTGSILSNLLYLKGEKLSYRTLDVEQIGSVYENIMGFQVRTSPGLTIALKPKKSHGAPVHIDLDSLLAAKPADRAKHLLEQADTKLPDSAEKLLKVATSTTDLLAALEKRIDRRATPQALPPGSIILQPTDERRRSGSHYTPRSFTQPIVRKTLEPILDRLGRHPQPEEILALKVADIAVGSAAFLVETCRQLGRELVSAWEYHKSTPRIPPDEDAERHAMRIIAQRCLYGVDRNPMAVDLAKLSLWLATMAKDHPFTFLDHSIKCGDSLVGLTNKQIAAFHWDTAQAKQLIMGQTEMEKLMARIATNRKSILDWTDDNEAAVLKKRDYLAAANDASRSLKTTGDLIIAAFFAGEKPKERQQNRDEFLRRHLELQKGDAQQIPWEVNILKELRGGDYPIRPFHWEIEFPEVFSRENPGFDAIVGNPPFLGGTNISASHGMNYFQWLIAAFPPCEHHCDLIAYFFRQAFSHIIQGGSFGLIATNSIAEGDTREGGLTEIAKRGGKVYSAESRFKWPGAAAVTVSIIHVIKSIEHPKPLLNGKPVDRISAFLVSGQIDQSPKRLSTNPYFSLGCKIYGQGFLFADDDLRSSPIQNRADILREHPDWSSRILPYLGGEEITTDPFQRPSRFAINLSDLPTEADLADYPELREIVREKVKPERDVLGSNPNNIPLKRRWWAYQAHRPELYCLLEKRKRTLCIARVGQHIAFAFAPTSIIFSEQVVVLVVDAFSGFACLQARLHENWVRFFGSSLEDRQRYTPSDCFETFPFPLDWETNDALEQAGRAYYEFRAALMIRNDEGLTKTYNRFHDPEEPLADIRQLRELHAAMDRAVLDAYGWPDIPTACEFLLDYVEDEEAEETPGKKTRKKKKPWRYRWPDDIRDEVLARLLALNAERATQEKLSGTTKKTAKKAAAKKVAKKALPNELVLFGLQENPWDAAIERLVAEIPTRKREPAPSSLAYYRILIPALLQEAGGSLPLDLLFASASLLEDPDALLEASDHLTSTSKKQWKEQFREAVDAAAFRSALKSLAVGGQRVRIVGTADNLEIRDLPGEKITLDWIITDARLTLKAARKLATEGQETTAPAELAGELAPHSRIA